MSTSHETPVLPELRITDEAVAILRGRIGKPEPHPIPPHYTRPDVDAFRHVAQSYGDDNPLWCDPDYAAQTRWNGPIAPPPLTGGDTLVGEDVLTDEERASHSERRGDPLRGVHAFYGASRREWWAPMRPSRRIMRRNALVGVLDKPSEFAGRAIHEWTAAGFQDEDGVLLGAQYKLMIRTERREARSRNKNADVEIRPYTEDGLSAIEAAYASEGLRGAEPRWYEDVTDRQDLGTMVKGPLTVTDMVCWHVGMGMGMYGVAPLRLGYKNRQRIPRFYHRDELNVPDVMQRVHWDPEFARRSGNPTTFDYGRMRETWMIHLCTDWMGDDAWLWQLEVEFRKFNYVGDTQWVSGRIARAYEHEQAGPAIDVELACTNQRGEVTTTGTATILLPSRRYGVVRLPQPPGGATSLTQAFDAIIAGFARQ